MDDKINNDHTSLYFLYSIFIKFVFQLSNSPFSISFPVHSSLLLFRRSYAAFSIQNIDSFIAIMRIIQIESKFGMPFFDSA